MKTLRQMTQGWLWALILALVGVIANLLFPVLVSAAVVATSDTSDQAQQNGDYEMPIGGTGPTSWSKVAQIATANKLGFLDRVSVWVDNLNATDAVSVSIQTLSLGLPSGTIIGTGRIPASALPPSGSPNWVSVKISGSTKLAMTPGTQFAIVLSAPVSGIMRWYAAGDVYPGGQALAYTTGGGWGPLSADARFQTFVIADAVDVIQNQGDVMYDRLSTTPTGQTFTVASSGILDRVGIILYNSASANAPIAVSVRTVTSEGLPTVTQVASGTIPATALPNHGTAGWAIGNITPVFLTAGTKYAVLFSTSAVGLDWAFGGDVYSGGTVVSGVVGSKTDWQIADWLDATFETFVIPPILDQQQKDGQDYGVLPTGGGAQVSFTPTWSGKLAQVGVRLADRPPEASPVVGLFESPTVLVTINASDGTIRGNGSISASFPDSPWWFYPALSGTTTTLPEVTAGQVYAIHLTASAGGLYWLYLGDLPNYDYQSYILPLTNIAFGPAPPPSEAITPCSSGVCPRASGGLTPADFAAGITSHFLFQERPNGTIQGVFAFSDPSPSGITLKGCTTESPVCRLTIATFACSGTSELAITGTYALRDEDPKYFGLTLSGISKEPGTFTLNAGEYQYTLTQTDIVNVTCPSTIGAPMM